MIPRLLSTDATNFNVNGFGALTGAVACNVVEELNGKFELNLELLVTDPNFQNIQIGSIISAKPNLTQERQGFVVESISKEINGVVSIYATHIGQYRAKLIPVTPFTATSLATALTGIISNSQETNPFTLTTDKSSSTDYVVTVPHSMRELLGGTEGSLRDIYGGDLYFDNYSIQLLAKRGTDNGVRVMYGQNMTDYSQTDDFSWNGSATGVLPYWYSEEDGLVQGDIQYSQYQNLYKYNKTVTVDFSQDFETKPTKAALETYAASWINSKGLPATNIKVTFDHMDALSDIYNLHIGDTVHIINSLYQVNYESRVVGMDFDVLSENYNSVTIGDIQTSINEAINGAVTDTTTDYGSLSNKPQINSVYLIGNRTTGDLGLQDALTRPFAYKGSPTNNDLDNCTEMGLYFITTTTGLTNAPINAVGFCLVFEVSARYQTQIYIRLVTSNYDIWMRKNDTNSGWGNWKMISSPTVTQVNNVLEIS